MICFYVCGTTDEYNAHIYKKIYAHVCSRIRGGTRQVLAIHGNPPWHSMCVCARHTRAFCVFSSLETGHRRQTRGNGGSGVWLCGGVGRAGGAWERSTLGERGRRVCLYRRVYTTRYIHTISLPCRERVLGGGEGGGARGPSEGSEMSSPS